MSGVEYWDGSVVSGPRDHAPTLRFTKVKDTFISRQLPVWSNCYHCPKRFVSFTKLQQHSRQHSGARPFICHECKRRFQQLRHLKHHQNRHHPQVLICKQCRRGYRNNVQYYRHVLRMHGPECLRVNAVSRSKVQARSEVKTVPKLSLKLCLKKAAPGVMDLQDSESNGSWAVKKKRKKHKKHKEKEKECRKSHSRKDKAKRKEISEQHKQKLNVEEKPRIILKFKMPKTVSSNDSKEQEASACSSSNSDIGGEHKASAAASTPGPTQVSSKQEQPFTDIVQSPSPKDSGIDDCSPLHEMDHVENCSSKPTPPDTGLGKEYAPSSNPSPVSQASSSQQSKGSPTSSLADTTRDWGYESCAEKKDSRKAHKSSHISPPSRQPAAKSESTGSLQVQFKRSSDGSLTASDPSAQASPACPSPIPSLKLTISKKASGKLRGAKYTSSLHVSPHGSEPQSPRAISPTASPRTHSRVSRSPSASPHPGSKHMVSASPQAPSRSGGKQLPPSMGGKHLPHHHSSASSSVSSADSEVQNQPSHGRDRPISGKSPRSRNIATSSKSSPRYSRADSWSPGRSSLKSCDSPRLSSRGLEFDLEDGDDLDPYAFDDEAPSMARPRLLPYTSTLPKRSARYHLDPLPPILEPQLSQPPPHSPSRNRPRLTRQTDLLPSKPAGKQHSKAPAKPATKRRAKTDSSSKPTTSASLPKRSKLVGSGMPSLSHVEGEVAPSSVLEQTAVVKTEVPSPMMPGTPQEDSVLELPPVPTTASSLNVNASGDKVAKLENKQITKQEKDGSSTLPSQKASQVLNDHSQDKVNFCKTMVDSMALNKVLEQCGDKSVSKAVAESIVASVLGQSHEKSKHAQAKESKSISPKQEKCLKEKSKSSSDNHKKTLDSQSSVHSHKVKDLEHKQSNHKHDKSHPPKLPTNSEKKSKVQKINGTQHKTVDKEVKNMVSPHKTGKSKIGQSPPKTSSVKNANSQGSPNKEKILNSQPSPNKVKIVNSQPSPKKVKTLNSQPSPRKTKQDEPETQQVNMDLDKVMLLDPIEKEFEPPPLMDISTLQQTPLVESAKPELPADILPQQDPQQLPADEIISHQEISDFVRSLPSSVLSGGDIQSSDGGKEQFAPTTTMAGCEQGAEHFPTPPHTAEKEEIPEEITSLLADSEMGSESQPSPLEPPMLETPSSPSSHPSAHPINQQPLQGNQTPAGNQTSLDESDLLLSDPHLEDLSLENCLLNCDDLDDVVGDTASISDLLDGAAAAADLGKRAAAGEQSDPIVVQLPAEAGMEPLSLVIDNEDSMDPFDDSGEDEDDLDLGLSSAPVSLPGDLALSSMLPLASPKVCAAGDDDSEFADLQAVESPVIATTPPRKKPQKKQTPEKQKEMGFFNEFAKFVGLKQPQAASHSQTSPHKGYDSEFAKFLGEKQQRRSAHSPRQQRQRMDTKAACCLNRDSLHPSTSAPCQVCENCVAAGRVPHLTPQQLASLQTSHHLLHQLGEDTTRLLRAMFPALEVPAPGCGASKLMQKVRGLLGEDPQLPLGESAQRCWEPTVHLCSRPEHCLSHLRRDVCDLLQALLPQLDLPQEFDRTGPEVDALIRQVAMSNVT